MGSHDFAGDYTQLPGGELENVGACFVSVSVGIARVDVPFSRLCTGRSDLFPPKCDVSRYLRDLRFRRCHLPRPAVVLCVLPRPTLSHPSLSVPRADVARAQDGRAGHSDQGRPERLVAMCPKCSCQLLIPPGVPTVACGSCGQVISPVVNGSYGEAMGAPAPAPAPPSSEGKIVKCPLCGAMLQAPPGASLAICGGCHQVIGMPDAQGDALARGQDGAHGMAPDMSHQREMTAIISCPSCSLQLQPPPGAPLVACGGCGQVMQVPGVARLE